MTTTPSEVEDKFAGKPIDTNELGGKQSRLERRFDLISPIALQRLAHVLWYGAIRYGDDNWKGIFVEDHLNHAIDHVYAFLTGDTDEDHLGHAFCRLMMALDTFENGVVPQDLDRDKVIAQNVTITPPTSTEPVVKLADLEEVFSELFGDDKDAIRRTWVALQDKVRR
jgi:hypothetical protein